MRHKDVKNAEQLNCKVSQQRFHTRLKQHVVVSLWKETDAWFSIKHLDFCKIGLILLKAGKKTVKNYPVLE